MREIMRAGVGVRSHFDLVNPAQLTESRRDFAHESNVVYAECRRSGGRL